MEFLKNFGKGVLQGAAIGGASVGITATYDNAIKDYYPEWLVKTIDVLTLIGCSYTGFKVTNALSNYLEEKGLD